MRSRREVLRVAGAMVLLPVLGACSRRYVRLEWVERWFHEHPAVAAVDLNFSQDGYFWQAPRLADGSVELKPNLPADQVVAFNRYVTELIHRESPHLSGRLGISDPGYEGGRPRHGGRFTFPDFDEFPSVEVVETATRHWLDMTSRYAGIGVELGWDEFRPDTPNVHTDLGIDESGLPAALATAYGDFARHSLPSSVTTSWDVVISDPSFTSGNPNAFLPSRYGSRDGLPPDPAVQAMMSLATLNQQLSPDERAAIYASWRPDDGHRHFLGVRINLRPRELRDRRSGNIHGAIPGSSAPRMTDTFVEQVDKVGIPYELTVDVFESEPFVTLDRRTK